MSWELRQTKRFARAYKKLHDNMAGEVDSAITEVSINPDVGDTKKGDLSALWVHRLRCQGQLYLLGYTRDDEIKLIWLEALGSHENFVSGHQAFIAG